MKTSPTKRTLDRLKADGWKPFIAEKWNAFAGVRQDAWGFVDVIAFNGEGSRGMLCVQATTAAHIRDRIAKIEAVGKNGKSLLPIAVELVAAGNRFEVWGWRKVGARGKAKRWALRVVALELADDPTRDCAGHAWREIE